MEFGVKKKKISPVKLADFNFCLITLIKFMTNLPYIRLELLMWAEKKIEGIYLLLHCGPSRS